MKEITVVIITKDRPELLENKLSFYLRKGVINLIVADSSTNHKTKLLVEEKYPNYKHLLFKEDVYPNMKVKMSLKFVNTPFLVVGSDDDYLNTDFFVLAIEQLQRLDSVDVVQGITSNFYPEDFCYKIKTSFGLSLLNDNPVDRLLDHLLNYHPTYYSVTRTKHLENVYSELTNNYSKGILGELYQTCNNLLKGKLLFIEEVDCARSIVTASYKRDISPTKQEIHDFYEILGVDDEDVLSALHLLVKKNFSSTIGTFLRRIPKMDKLLDERAKKSYDKDCYNEFFKEVKKNESRRIDCS